VAHEHEASAAGPFEIFDRGGIGHVVGVEADPLVGDADLESIREESIGNVDAFASVHLVAVLDGVDQGFFESEPDAEDFLIAGSAGSELFFDGILDTSSLGMLARDGHFREWRMAEVACGLHRCEIG
jgi:hypothetical protein